LKERLIADLDICLNDTTQAWELDSDGSYQRVVAERDEDALTAQTRLLTLLAENSGAGYETAAAS
jgi:polyphosphate kinase